MPKIKRLEHTGMEAYIFSCPGCEMEHMLPVSYTPEYAAKVKELRGPNWRPVTWSFLRRDLDKPTFSPSLLNTWDFNDKGQSQQRCHLFVRDGQIVFCPDSTHRLAGKTVDMLEA